MDAAVAVIINPVSGTGGRPDAARRRAELAANVLAARGLPSPILVTERPGHARELASALVAQRVATVIAWGGDGTVNEVGSALAFTPAALAIVPSGSGNGLARELRIPLTPRDALAIALDGRDRMMDAGEIEARLFFNVAGIGLDARVAHRFAADGLVRRGFARYLEITAGELMSRHADQCSIAVDGTTIRANAMLIAIANSRQYGNGALIAPNARIDDGQLDVVVIQDRSPMRALMQVPRVFLGQLGRVPGVTMLQGRDVRLAFDGPVPYHADGEPFLGGAVMTARIRPSALRVRVPR